MKGIAVAATWYRTWVRFSRWHAERCVIGSPEQCESAQHAGRMLDAASLAYDNAVAETYAGRNPRGALSREIPL